MISEGIGGISPKIKNALVVVIGGVWATSVMLEFFFPNRFDLPTGINELVMLVAGAIFAAKNAGDDSQSKKADSEGGDQNA